MATRAELESAAAKRIAQTRVRLFMDKRSVFFATLAKRLVPKVAWGIPTAATDGKVLLYNPEFIMGLTTAECLGVHIHEVMHCSQRHPVRRGNRDHKLFNVACDLAINPIIIQAGFALPDDRLTPGKDPFPELPVGLSAEEYYARLQQQQKQQKPQSGQNGQGQGGQPGPAGESGDPAPAGDQADPQADKSGQQPGQQSDTNGTPGSQAGDDDSSGGEEANGDGSTAPGNLSPEELREQCDPGGCGQVLDAPGSAAEKEVDAAEWQVAVAQAAQLAKRMGHLPECLERFVDATLQPKVTWQDVLVEFVSQTMTARDDYSWSSPNRRYISQGMYLPSLRSDAIGELVVAIDTSGSIENETLRQFAGELNGILECRPCKVHIVYCDAQVNATEEWTPEDGELALTKGIGGGGTSHRPVWKWIEDQRIDPAAVVCLTDGFTEFGREPPYPVLWALTPDGTDKPPFGRSVRIL